ncbi:DUF4055 domain-containing protein [Sphingobium limneticum]|uniref:DUF4055 domain-containing protein n=1 Tax=Sphingobium limneticum TaxID=1007511 RepID=A0A5J5I4F6_9SPHN|nr:DUF4055 domain-containing protein [Sphingobium limneticum]KAA9018292.1 DUF4055 domain-containing protein [Sphingobium limneticum]KAA9030928.1 DUF4055 domain-containing protein [Sphingobium limneticum]
MTEQNIQCERLSRHAPQVKKVRDFVAGETAVKAALDLYMPVPSVGMNPLSQSFKNFLRRTSFFPAAARVLDGCLSLVFQKDPVLVSETVAQIKDSITYDMESLELFAEKLVSETLQTNYTGVLVDAPSDDERPANLNGQNAVDLGYHPFLSLYPFEAILDHRVGRVGNKQAWTYVKLSDGEHKYRELRLTAGIYSVTVHERIDGQGEYQSTTVIPKRDGKPLDFIPFKLVTTKKDRWPTKALIDDVVNVNCNHYILEGDHASALFNCAGPQKVVVNPAKQTDADGNPIANEYPAGSDHVWEIHGAGGEGQQAGVHFLEFTGTSVVAIREQLKELKSQMSALGSRILQDEKAAPEAAEALAIRRTSENATIVGLTRSVAKDLEEVLRWLAWWMGAANKTDPATRFTLNVDLVPAKLTPQEVTEIRNLRVASAYTAEEEFYALRDGGWHADTLTWEKHKAAIDAEVIDQPLALPSIGAE